MPSITTQTPHARLIRKLESIADLTSAEKEALGELPIQIRDVPRDTDLVSEGDRPSHCCLVIEGFACRYKMLAEGRRQIMAFQMAGDIPDLQSLHLRVMDHALGALTPMVAGFVPHAALHDVIRRQPGLGSVFWRDTLIDAAVFREWLVGIGRRSGAQHMAHLICELLVKMRAVGLTDGETLTLPFTQEDLGDAMGLTSVHVNRVLQELRREGLISGQGRIITVTDWAGLKAFSEFDPTYLHIRKLAA